MYKHVRCHGLLGTYDDGLAWLKKPEHLERPKCILWLGSSIGNLDRKEAAHFLSQFSPILRAQDTMLIGIDACKDKDKVFHAYNDKDGKTHDFILNGLLRANTIMGQEIFRKDFWKVIGEYDEEAGRHQAFVVPLKDVAVGTAVIRAGEKVRIEESYKYSLPQSAELWDNAGLVPKARFGNRVNQYRRSSYGSPFRLKRMLSFARNAHTYGHQFQTFLSLLTLSEPLLNTLSLEVNQLPRSG